MGMGTQSTRRMGGVLRSSRFLFLAAGKAEGTLYLPPPSGLFQSTAVGQRHPRLVAALELDRHSILLLIQKVDKQLEAITTRRHDLMIAGGAAVALLWDDQVFCLPTQERPAPTMSSTRIPVPVPWCSSTNRHSPTPSEK